MLFRSSAGGRRSRLHHCEHENRTLKDTLDVLKKNSLRQPVVEKILNQMINLINELIEKHSEKDEKGNIVKYFKFDEIHIELARELKKNAEERRELDSKVREDKNRNEKIIAILKSEFDLPYPTQNDIIRYRLYEELKDNCYKDLYTNTYIPREKLFSKKIDIEHIIPKSRLFNDSFSNKTICYRQDNLNKGERTAYDYIEGLGKTQLDEYLNRVENLYTNKFITKAKYRNLLKKESEIGDGFIERDRNC